MTATLQKSVAAAALLVLFLSTRLAWGGPPFVTDDPDPVEYQHWEVYLFSIYNHIHTPKAQTPLRSPPTLPNFPPSK